MMNNYTLNLERISTDKLLPGMYYIIKKQPTANGYYERFATFAEYDGKWFSLTGSDEIYRVSEGYLEGAEYYKFELPTELLM